MPVEAANVFLLITQLKSLLNICSNQRNVEFHATTVMRNLKVMVEKSSTARAQGRTHPVDPVKPPPWKGQSEKGKVQRATSISLGLGIMGIPRS